MMYWYFDNGESKTQDLPALIRFMLRQLSAQLSAHVSMLPRAVWELAKECELSNSSPSVQKLVQVLLETIGTVGFQVMVVLDALDEYKSGNVDSREELLNVLVSLVNAKVPNLHLLVTATPDEDIQQAFRQLNRPSDVLNVEPPIAEDLNAYLDSVIEKQVQIRPWWDKDVKEKVLKGLRTDGSDFEHAPRRHEGPADD